MPPSMEPEQNPKSRRLRIPAWLLNGFWALLTIGLIFLIEYVVGWGRILAAWSVIPYDVILVSVGMTLLSYLSRAGRLYSHFPSEMKGQFGRCLRVVLHHNLFTNVLPMRAGEFSFPILLQRHFKISAARSTGALFSFRILDLGVLALIGLLSMVLGYRVIENISILILLVVLIPLSAWLLLKSLHLVANSWPRLTNISQQLISGLPKQPHEFVRLTAWTLLLWSIKLAGFAWILRTLAETPFWTAMLASLAGDLASNIPVHTPAAFGSFEGGVLAVLLPAGVSHETALAAAVNLHLFLLGVSCVSAAFALLLGRDSHDAR
jgi:uncharacterized membrane protein YbhN (UPF0104 family)